MIQIKGFLSLFSYKSLSKLFVYVWYVHGCEPAYMQVRAGVCVGTRGLHQMSFSITLHFPLGDRDGTIALVEPGAFHFRQMGQPGSFWDPPSPPVLFSVSTGSLAFAVRFFFLPVKSFPQPQVHILIAGITIIFAAEDIRIIGTK